MNTKQKLDKKLRKQYKKGIICGTSCNILLCNKVWNKGTLISMANDFKLIHGKK